MSQQDQPEQKVVKRHRFNGLLEWILEREGHEFMIEVDREYIRDQFNHVGLMEKFMSDLNLTDETMSKTQFKLYLKHLYKSSAPTQANLEDEKYLQFIQDAVDMYGLIHANYVKSPEGKSLAQHFYRFFRSRQACS